ncbi:ATP-binding protein [Roseovarius arcticus]|uniref:ATP-binding protein n=1 Tax=Roseovarius arcticus TaxID=2547404 RepID=UPI0011109F66|nr:ATP-binding protein [Roseovarius arcticus]
MTAAQSQPTKVFDLIASANEIRAGLSEIRMHLRAAGLSHCECGTTEIVLAEAFNNIAEHAYANSGVGNINVAITLDDGSALIEVTDTGAPLPGLSAPAGKPPRLDGPSRDLPEGGYGWFLIRQLTAALTYDRHDGRNILRLRMSLPCTQQPAALGLSARSN